MVTHALLDGRGHSIIWIGFDKVPFAGGDGRVSLMTQRSYRVDNSIRKADRLEKWLPIRF